MPNAVFFYLLFNDFYKKSYNKPIVVKSSKKDGQLTNGNVTSPPVDTKANGHCNGTGNGSITTATDNKDKAE